ncbi:uroporphyrinogen decarboxylase [Sandaracinobacteroides saxicola]|uniref:Uroporphyrinogen decarboxylase n=1 Tax=Sandaracinobacteroides saxicola TaxID=2759707 RepID=A0A7G5IH92_9SPHN|nr:uroporphyrinogen decarboxylase [Sandaracinobacteroides saxicola]QMW22734.1 uroporphyrinogen decarboxylase [Sandaracinobacteroides saxicola]
MAGMKPILATLAGQILPTPPLWLMRQAGRYLPEYRALRAEKGSFLNLVYDSDAAAEITLQPIRRFGMDAAILFSDILIVPHALGQQLTFTEGEGPRLTPPLTPHDPGAWIDGLTPALHHFDPIYQTVAKVAAALPPHVTLIGFAGSPWTVATYMVAGHGTKEQAPARTLAYRDPAAFQALIDRISATTLDYLSGQVMAGAEALQLFDSWSGSLAPSEFDRWVIAPTAALVAQLKARHPHIPVIGFPKGAGEKLPRYARETHVDAVGLDEALDPAWAHANLPADLPVQGNLDPLALLAGGEPLTAAITRICEALAGRPHIFNLGHGILQQTPIPHVEALLTHLRA